MITSSTLHPATVNCDATDRATRVVIAIFGILVLVGPLSSSVRQHSLRRFAGRSGVD
jgi:hypothetical protein